MVNETDFLNGALRVFRFVSFAKLYKVVWRTALFAYHVF